MIGTSIGAYRITAKLEAGGMGEVYRAHDTKLDHDVAIKILPDIFAHDAERVRTDEKLVEWRNGIKANLGKYILAQLNCHKHNLV